MSQILFLKSNIPHIRTNEGELEVINPEFIFQDPEKKRDPADMYIAYKILEGTEWPYGVELIELYQLNGTDGWVPFESVSQARGGTFTRKLFARLIPEEKKAESAYKEFETAGTVTILEPKTTVTMKTVESKENKEVTNKEEQELLIVNEAINKHRWESDYKEFEPLSKEQFSSPQNQNRDNAIIGFLKTGLDKIDELGVNLSNDDKARLLNRRIENLSKPIESSEPQEKSIESEKYELRRILQMQVNCLREDEMDNSDAVAIRGTTAQRIMKFLDPVSAPSESQEELLIDLLNIWVVFPADQAKERILKSFTLTRLTP